MFDKIAKKDIIFGGTIVGFRNGLYGIALENTAKYGNDGDEVFLVMNDDGTFSQQRLCCFDENLKCTLSIDTILDVINDVMDGKKPEYDEERNDTSWDVVWQRNYANATFDNMMNMLASKTRKNN